jgi:hypothetical protein
MHNHFNFIQTVLAEFPELSEKISYCDGDPYSEMGTFASFTQNAKNAEDWDNYGRSVQLIASLLPQVDEDLLNEIYVSYLEHLDFEEPNGLKAWRLLPINVQNAWHEIIDYDEKLIGRPWAKTKYKISE